MAVTLPRSFGAIDKAGCSSGSLIGGLRGGEAKEVVLGSRGVNLEPGSTGEGWGELSAYELKVLRLGALALDIIARRSENTSVPPTLAGVETLCGRSGVRLPVMLRCLEKVSMRERADDC